MTQTARGGAVVEVDVVLMRDIIKGLVKPEVCEGAHGTAGWRAAAARGVAGLL